METERDFRIRSAEPADAAAFLELKLALDEESDFMMLEPGERREAPAQVEAHLAAVARRANATILVAQDDGHLIAYVGDSLRLSNRYVDELPFARLL